MAAVAPGPPGHWLWGNLPEFRRDALGLVLGSARRFGDVVRFRLGPVVVHLLNHPDLVDHVLVRNAPNYVRQGRSARLIQEVCGRSLLTTDGPFWREHRRLMQPVFQSSRVEPLAGLMRQAVGEMLERWSDPARRGQPVGISSEMSRLAFTIAGRALFGEDLSGDAAAVEAALTEVMEGTFARVQSVLAWPRWVPTARNGRFRAALSQLDRIVYRIVEGRRNRAVSRSDLLSVLIEASGHGRGFSDQDLRNECITLLLAGHETTANALTWTFHLLARHPQAQERVRAEVLEVLGAELPAADDSLPFTTAVLEESMRLYPPIWILERRVVAEDEIGGVRIPAGSMVVISPWALHRHPAFWPEPDAFRPERFLERSNPRYPRAYIPFGVGPHQCIGRHFALLEARLVLGAVARRFRWEPVEEIRPRGGITLRPEPGLQVRVQSVGR